MSSTQNLQLQSYLQSKDLSSLFSSLFQSITVSKPKDPISFIIDELKRDLETTTSNDITFKHHKKILIVGNQQKMAEKILAALCQALGGPTEESTGSTLSPLAYTTSTHRHKINSRLDALKLQEKGLSPDLVVWCHMSDFDQFLKANQLDDTQYSQSQFTNDNFTQQEILNVFKGGASVVDATNELNVLTVLGRVMHAIIHNNPKAQATKRIAIIGAPGAGCTTHATRVASIFNVPRLEPNNVLAAIANEQQISSDNAPHAASLSAQVRQALDSNQPVSDDLLNKAMLQRMSQEDCRSGYVLDGYPRTKQQTDFIIAKGLAPELIVLLRVTPDVAEARIKGRQIHTETGQVFHEIFAPADSPANLVKRPQDSDEGYIKAALRAYKTDEDSMILELQDSIHEVDAQQNNVQVVQHKVVNACFGEHEDAEKIFVIGAPLSRMMAVAEEIAKSRNLILINGASSTSSTEYERTSQIVKKLRSPQCAKGWVLAEFPTSAEQAELLVQNSIVPTKIVVLNLKSEQAVERAKKTTAQDSIQNDYFHYVTNRDAILNQFRGLLHPEGDKESSDSPSHIATVNAAQLLPKLSQDIACFLEGKRSPLRLIFAGAPASGKGTQCEMIRDKYNLIHLSTGDMLREAVKEQTELGLEAAEYMNKGALVPDRLIEGIVAVRLNMPDCLERGWLLDGFPRTSNQADFLVRTNNCPDAVILLDVPDEVVIGRISGRRTDPVSGNVFHLEYNPPPTDEIAARVVQRSDDTKDKVKVRLSAFHNNLGGILTTFGEQIFRVNGNQKKELVTANIVDFISELKRV